MKRIVLLIRSLDVGGSQRQLLLLATNLPRYGVGVHVMTFYPGGALLGDLQAAGVPVTHLGKRGRWDFLPFFGRLVRSLRLERPDVLYGFLPVANMLTVLAGLLVPRVRIVWGVRASTVDFSRHDWLARLTAAIERTLAPFTDKIIANSEAGRAYHMAQGFPTDKICVIPNGIDTERFRFDLAGRRRMRSEWGVKEDEIVVGVSARLDPMKGYETFLEAVSLLAPSAPQVRFVCVGGGPVVYGEKLMALARALGIADRVIWAGSRKGMPAVYSAFDIACSPSYSEGFSNAIAEAMSCARPCVVTDVGDSASIVGEAERVVPPRDAAALAKQWAALTELAANEREEIGLRARRRMVDHFSADSMVMRTIQVLG